MCGIAGWLGRGPASGTAAASVAAMIEAMAHRGPDRRGVRVLAGSPASASVCLGHARLAILDLSDRADQPMTDPRTGNWIVLNGEIYNYRELADHADLRDRQRRTHSDTEVILHAYARWGTDCVQRLRGMFAFALWDASRQELWCVRDRLGVKPFYFHAGGGRFAFASELRALVASGAAAPALDPRGLASLLRFGSVEEPGTILRDVRTLAPGTWLRVNGRGRVLQRQRYWSLEQAFASKTDVTENAEEQARRVREAVSESVACRLVSDVPLGAFLSGGIDSSAVVAMMARAASRPVKTFSVAFADAHSRRWNETAHARLVARRYGTEHTEIRLAERQVLDWLPDALSSIDQPTGDGINTWVVARATRQAGVTVALSGLGGDELFGGYPSFRHVPTLARLARWMARVPSGLRDAASRLWGRWGAGSIRMRKLAELWRQDGNVPDAYRLYRQLFPSDWAESVLADGPKAWIAPEQEPEPLDDLDPFDAVSALELRTYLANTLLRDTDTMGMSHALEIRVPLIDHELVELVAGMPAAAKRGDGTVPKPLLVRAMGDDLPESIVRRPKMGFVLPFDRWLRGPLAERVAETLGSRDAVTDAGLRPNAVGQLWRRFTKRAPEVTWSRVWALFVMVDWTRRLQGWAGAASGKDRPIRLARAG